MMSRKSNLPTAELSGGFLNVRRRLREETTPVSASLRYTVTTFTC
jgi:hypothetical protein